MEDAKQFTRKSRESRAMSGRGSTLAGEYMSISKRLARVYRTRVQRAISRLGKRK